ncbi:MAG: hypothetical protein U5O39_13505 [Gammaproteobacteria bacterium]|nr:hypothetical protein [Gammaproteobacteria bacterium]
MSTTCDEILGRLDEARGGFGGAPKFPNEMMLDVLLDDIERNGNEHARRALTLTLDRMCQGGIHDHIAGGFHRYTVDADWLVPHFEKMLYNQAQLLRVYARGARLTGSREWRRVARNIAGYVLRDMTDAEGAFFSATDADSQGEEGKFFVWSPDEIEEALDPDDAEMVRVLYQVTDNGNFEGRNILNPGQSLEAFAESRGLDVESFYARLDRIHETLYHVREQREHPVRDEKVITGWNGMMITASGAGRLATWARRTGSWPPGVLQTPCGTAPWMGILSGVSRWGRRLRFGATLRTMRFTPKPCWCCTPSPASSATSFVATASSMR